MSISIRQRGDFLQFDLEQFDPTLTMYRRLVFLGYLFMERIRPAGTRDAPL